MPHRNCVWNTARCVMTIKNTVMVRTWCSQPTTLTHSQSVLTARITELYNHYFIPSTGRSTQTETSEGKQMS